MITVEGLRVVYKDVISVLHGISLRLEDGQITTLLGANGAGKTTLLRTLSGVLEIYDGEVLEGFQERKRVDTHSWCPAS